MSDVTLVLDAINRGERQAAEKLLPLVYDELRNLAAARMLQESAGHTLQPTALVHEAWLRLTGGQEQSWQNRAHFFGAAAEAMRRILVDHARRKAGLKHGGGQQRLNFEDFDLAEAPPDEKILLIDEALEELERCESRTRPRRRDEIFRRDDQQGGGRITAHQPKHRGPPLGMRPDVVVSKNSTWHLRIDIF